MRFRVFALMVPVAVCAFAAGAWCDADDDESEVEIGFCQAPKAVQNAIRGVTHYRSVEEIERVTEDGGTYYDVEYRTRGGEGSLAIAASGEIIQHEQPIAARRLPAAIRAAIAERMPGAVITEAEHVVLRSYEVLVTVNGKRIELEAYASGHVDVEDSDVEDDEDDDDADDADDEEDDDDDDDDDED